MNKIENFKKLHKQEIDEINSIYEDLEKDKKIQRLYNKFLKKKEKENLKFSYNKINKKMTIGNLIKNNTKKITVFDNTDYKISNHYFC